MGVFVFSLSVSLKEKPFLGAKEVKLRLIPELVLGFNF